MEFFYIWKNFFRVVRILKTFEEVREDIPLLQKVIYLDSAATTPKPRQVVKAMEEYFFEYCANVGRGAHSLAQKSTEEYEKTREKIAKFLNVKPKEIIFTKNCTEAINIVASGLNWKENDKIIVSNIEHHSNFLPWQRIAKNFKVKLDVVAATKDGMILPSAIEEKLDKNTKVIAITHISNVLGTIQPINEISKLAKDFGALTVGHIKVDLKKINCDFFAFSGHKGLLGPQGTGGLWSKHLGKLEPLTLGGGAVFDVAESKYELLQPPHQFEAGTPNIPGIIGLGRAIDYVNEIGIENIEKYNKKLLEVALKQLGQIEKVEVYGPKTTENKADLVSFNVSGINPHDVAIILDESERIIIRSGHHCAIPAVKMLGTDGTARASFHYYNLESEIGKLATTLEKISKLS